MALRRIALYYPLLLTAHAHASSSTRFAHTLRALRPSMIRCAGNTASKSAMKRSSVSAMSYGAATSSARKPHIYAGRTLRRVAAMSRTFSAAPTVPVVDKQYVEGLSQRILEGSDERLIDVRERDELDFGAIPGSINIPLSEFVDALEMSEDQWKERYGIPKIMPDDDVVVYCKSGMRSHQAAAYAAAKGHGNWANYQGSYIDWFGQAY
mmetsp:Transcript_10097/g.16280  ORF Transcript_10097/g.16280 Transcript_10097/m.16280 type:complete len:209 (+) Transcript_10097:2-628(+)